MTSARIPPAVGRLIDLALEEDLSFGDSTSDALFEDRHRSRGLIESRQDLVLCGLSVAREVFRRVDPDLDVRTACRDGDRLPSSTPVLTVEGSTRSILMAERTALNFLQKLSGIATLTDRFVRAARASGSSARVCDTRKTVPGFRYLSKYAVRCGGGANHRFHLGDAAMIKDNHIAAAGSIRQAVAAVRAHGPHTLSVEVEADTLDQVRDALEAGADVILLDNMTPAQMREAVALAAGRALLEASGGIRLDTIAECAATGVDIISVGALTHSAPAADLALNLELLT